MSRIIEKPVEYFLFSPVACACTDRLADCEEIAITVDGRVKINAWYLHVDRPSAYVVSSHGKDNCVCGWAPYANKLRRRHNAAVLIYDYRGYGKSGGKPTLPGIVQDGEAAVKWLCRREKCKAANMIMHGYSLGGAVAVQLAARFKSRGLIVESSFSSIPAIARYSCGWLGGVAGQMCSSRLNSIAAIARYYGALLQCHGDLDDVVPYSQGRDLFNACPSENKTFVKLRGCGHTDEYPRNYLRKQKEFFASLTHSRK